MKVSYRREMKHNYLIINPESLVWRNYECRMLAANSIEGVLHFQIRQLDDEIRFFYEITSKQPLSRMLESRFIQKEELRRLVLGISQILDRMELYLLRENCILLEPDYIYVEPDTYRVWLCLIPGLERDFPEDYGDLLAYILGKVDHQDKDSVVLAYGLYQETQKENYGMEDILRILGNDGRDAFIFEEDESNVSEKNIGGRDPYEGELYEKGARKGKVSYEKKREKISGLPQEKDVRGNEVLGEPKKSMFSKLSSRLGKGKKKREQEIEVPWDMMFVENMDEEPVEEKGQDRRGLMGGVVESVPERPAPETVLLNVVSGNTRDKRNTKDRFLISQDTEEDIRIAYYPFIIGKQENLVDYVLDRDTVSRLHVRIDRVEEEYFVQDLNSTNGTMVNGQLLENNESVKLQIGDEIKIAGYTYQLK